MNRNFKICIVVCLLLGYFYESNMCNIFANYIKSEDINLEIKKDFISSHIKNLSKYNRVSGSEGDNICGSYLIARLSDFGYNIYVQEFVAYKQVLPKKINPEINSYLLLEDDKSSPGYNTRNIIAKNKNFDINKKTLYLTAHYDSEEKNYGVIDNATGVSIVLEIARLLQKHNGDINIVPIFFGAEELGLVGSRYFIKSLNSTEINNAIGCINIDMVGIKESDNLVMWSYDVKDKDNVENLEVNDNVLTYLLNKKTFKMENKIGLGTDAISFYGADIPAITITDEIYKREISYKNRNDQLNSISINRLAYICENISTIIKDFTIKEYNDILNTKKSPRI